jgi:4-diphosphocytidyl-2-C-methyl-D-erythritol kinase
MIGGAVVRMAAPAKLTVTLRITGVRSDGYHLLDSEMVTIDLADELEIDPARDGLEIVGAPTLVADDTNLVRRALVAAGRHAHVRLHKRIPAGGGLGGGSADAAAILRWAGVTDLALAATLGGDVPFCVVGGRAQVTGIGERVAPLAFEQRSFTLVTPPLFVSTPAVYRAWDELGGPTGVGPNDLEPAALMVEPRLAEWRDRLGDATGQTPMLAGSGATWFVEGSFEGPGLIPCSTVQPTTISDPA